MRIMGIDPGIVNTGLVVVEAAKHRYALLDAVHVKTSPKDCDGKQLSGISESTGSFMSAYNIDELAVERVKCHCNATENLDHQLSQKCDTIPGV